MRARYERKTSNLTLVSATPTIWSSSVTRFRRKFYDRATEESKFTQTTLAVVVGEEIVESLEL
jgi:hypothetical protein